MLLLKVKLYKWSLILSIVTIFIGALAKILHTQFANVILPSGLIISIVYIVLGTYDVYTNTKISKTEKIMWQTTFLFFNMLAGILYYNKYKLNNTNN